MTCVYVTILFSSGDRRLPLLYPDILGVLGFDVTYRLAEKIAFFSFSLKDAPGMIFLLLKGIMLNEMTFFFTLKPLFEAACSMTSSLRVSALSCRFATNH